MCRFCACARYGKGLGTLNDLPLEHAKLDFTSKKIFDEGLKKISLTKLTMILGGGATNLKVLVKRLSRIQLIQKVI